MLVKNTEISGLVILEYKRSEDDRGFFSRLFCEEELRAAGLEAGCSQINVSFSNYLHTLRGLHFQYPPHAEAKTITCITGAIYDVAIDLRANSTTFLESVGVYLNEGENRSLHVPPGLAHGFLTLKPATRVFYATSTPYAPLSEDGVRFDDPLIDVAWPSRPAVISNKDGEWPPLEPRVESIIRRFNER
jgi:dTDP-4-dehydrorhamnose 3,5-epimerase